MATLGIESKSPFAVGCEVPPPENWASLNFVDGVPLRLEQELGAHPGHWLGADVVVATLSEAWLFIEMLEHLDADCDVWGWTKLRGDWLRVDEA